MEEREIKEEREIQEKERETREEEIDRLQYNGAPRYGKFKKTLGNGCTSKESV